MTAAGHHVSTALWLAREAPPAGGAARPRLSCSRRLPHRQVRGKTTTTTVRLDELPQGAILADPVPTEEPGPTYPPVILQARRHMQRFDNCVLLTRWGGFYELYFEHAQEYGPLLNLKVGLKKTTAGPVPMVSLPLFSVSCLFHFILYLFYLFYISPRRSSLMVDRLGSPSSSLTAS